MRSLAILAVLCGLASADGPELQVNLAVGESAKRDVGYARGLRCDDTTIATADIATDTARDTNVVTFTGLKVGRTQCRAGLEVARQAYVFTIDVTAKNKSLPRR